MTMVIYIQSRGSTAFKVTGCSCNPSAQVNHPLHLTITPCKTHKVRVWLEVMAKVRSAGVEYVKGGISMLKGSVAELGLFMLVFTPPDVLSI